jgi:hypothetical protein
VIGSVPLHVPGFAVRVSPTLRVPEIVGFASFFGATSACDGPATPPPATVSAVRRDAARALTRARRRTEFVVMVFPLALALIGTSASGKKLLRGL